MIVFTFFTLAKLNLKPSILAYFPFGTTMFKDGKSIKFHLGYWTTFGDISDVEWYQYLEERGSIEWKGGNRSFKRESYNDEGSNSDNSIWDALEDEPEAAGNIDFEG